jgi:hypothetical protein
MASARRLLKAVIETYEIETATPLANLFDENLEEGPRR